MKDTFAKIIDKFRNLVISLISPILLTDQDSYIEMINTLKLINYNLLISYDLYGLNIRDSEIYPSKIIVRS